MTGSPRNVVIVTGGASGLGRALVLAFLREGAAVVAVDRDEAALATLRDEGSADLEVLAGDVADFATNERAVRTAVDRFGRLDTFVGNAAVFDYGAPLVEIPADTLGGAFDELFGVNVKGYLLGAKAALPELVRSRGSIVFTLSAAARHAACGGPLYTASKHAVVGLVRQLAYELAPRVRVNGVAPGAMRTRLSGPKALAQEAMSVASLLPPDEIAKQFEPLGRFAPPEAHVGPYLLLASRDGASTVTGEILYADSGVSIRGIQQPAGGRDLAARFGIDET